MAFSLSNVQWKIRPLEGALLGLAFLEKEIDSKLVRGTFNSPNNDLIANFSFATFIENLSLLTSFTFASPFVFRKVSVLIVLGLSEMFVVKRVVLITRLVKNSPLIVEPSLSLALIAGFAAKALSVIVQSVAIYIRACFIVFLLLKNSITFFLNTDE